MVGNSDEWMVVSMVSLTVHLMVVKMVDRKGKHWVQMMVLMWEETSDMTMVAKWIVR